MSEPVDGWDTASIGRNLVIGGLGVAVVATIALAVYTTSSPDERTSPAVPKPVESPEQSQSTPREKSPPNLPPIGSGTFRRGETMLFMPNELPAGLKGFPVPLRAGLDRFDKRYAREDGMGLIRASGPPETRYLRAQTKVQVLDPAPVHPPDTKERYIEVRVLSGPAANESVFVPEPFLGRSPEPPPYLVGISKLSEAGRRKVFDTYFARLDEALAPGASEMRPGARLQFETDAHDRHSALNTRDREDTGVREQVRIDAVIWYGLGKSWPYAFKDY